MITLEARGIGKTFQRRAIFREVSFGLAAGGSMAVTGRNGAGKSTLVKIVAGLLAPTRGETLLAEDGRPVPPAERFSRFGLVAPYLQLYDEFTGWENLDVARRIRGLRIPDERLGALLDRVSLGGREGDPVRTYSSGMKQRLKYAFALLHEPPVLLLDEPSSNLDAEGIRTVYAIMEEQKERGGILIVATNDADDLVHCAGRIAVGEEGA